MCFLGWTVAWVDHVIHCCRDPLARQQVQLCVWVLALVGGTLQVQEDQTIVPTIFDRDATDNRIVVDVAKAS